MKNTMNKKLIVMMVLCMAFPAMSIGMTDFINTKRLTLFGDYLYWYASQQTDAVWANDIGFPATNHVTYATPNLKFNWHSGVRAGISYALPQYWDLTFAWTHVKPNTTSQYTPPAFHVLTPEFFSGYLSGDSFSSADMHWKIDFNTYDFVISHAFQASPALTLRPIMGVKGATIHQTLNSHWHNTLFSIPIYTSSEIIKNNYAGVGPTFGLEGVWTFYQELSLAGKIATALMWGQWQVNDTYQRPAALFNLIKSAKINTHMRHSQLGAPMYQSFVGLQWLHDANYQLKFLLGYEMQYWANQLRVPTFQLLPLHGDLTLQGITCGLSISL